ncbi:MAG: VWA domain-containing protein [Verrucomicrobiae bacterium]|nr:VWA domain-containing protein [Verrucomicrobiae bacterium]
MILGSPWMLLLLAAVAVAGWLMARARRLQFQAACQLKGDVPETPRLGLGGRDCLALAALACIVFALARPQWDPRPHETGRRGRDVVIALDVSRSMLAADVFPSRLEAARIAIHEALPSWAGQRIALITFAGSASVRVPLTSDHGFVRYMLERADPSDMDVGSTSLQAAFEKAVGTVLSDASGGGRDIVVFTDGEDHLSDMGAAAGILKKSGARTLIIGLGDPAQGARVPDQSGTNQWMWHGGAEVVSRLQEGTLAGLAEACPGVTYYPARTRPFDLVPLYRQMISGASGDAVVGEVRHMRYSEGYPYLLGLAVGLWIASSSPALSGIRRWAALALLLHGCARQAEDAAEVLHQEKFKRGGELLQFAREQTAIDPPGARSLLLDAREQFLRAALLRPGDAGAARQITAITRQLEELDVEIEKHRVAEGKRGAQLGEIIGQLEGLAVSQARLAQQSARWLGHRVAPPSADLSESGASVNEIEYQDTDVGRRNSDRRLASATAKEQRHVQEGTAGLLEEVASQQKTLRELLARAYGDSGRPHATELDPAADLLSEAVAAQGQALASLAPESIRWPQANSALHVAAGRMQQAAEVLRGQQPPSEKKDNSAMPPMGDSGYDEDMDGTDFEGAAVAPKPVSAGDFRAALELRSLPIPNLTSAEVMAEEAANQQKRARQKAARAGARVEKNW